MRIHKVQNYKLCSILGNANKEKIPYSWFTIKHCSVLNTKNILLYFVLPIKLAYSISITIA